MAYITFKPSDNFNTKLYTGTGSSLANTGVGFQPDFTWIKSRSHTNYHTLTDTVRGVTKQLFINTTGAEQTSSTNISSFDSDGFTVVSANDVNGSGRTYASWNWKMGTTSGLSGGTLTPSAYSINTTAKQGIYKYTGTGASSATIPHGLGVAPDFVMYKKLSATGNWFVGHSKMDAPDAANFDYYNQANNTMARSNNAGIWNDTAPSSTLITLGATDGNDSGATYLMYAFASQRGYCATGYFIGNGNADGPFVYTGFKPRWILIKNSDAVEQWNIWDTKINSQGNLSYKILQLRDNAENTGGDQALDINGNGFKVKHASTEMNQNNARMIYIAFADQPIIGSGGTVGLAK